MFYSQKMASKIQDENLLFFIQTYLELSSYKTAESYKARMMMSISLCEEYKVLYLHEYVKNEYLEIIIDELSKSIKFDPIAKQMLSFTLEEYNKKGLSNNKDLKQQYSIIKLLLEELNPILYLNNSIDFIKNNLNKKNDIRLVTSNLISLLNQLNISNSYLYYACKKFFDNSFDSNKGTDKIIIDFFNEIIFELSGKYNVYIEIVKLPEFIDNDFFKKNLPDVSIIEKEEQKRLAKEKIFFSDTKSNIILFKDIHSSDPYNAIFEAQSLIKRIDIAQKIFHHADKIIYGQSDLAIDIETEVRYYFSNEISPITHQKHMQHALTKEKFQNFFSSFFIHSDSMHKFDKALTLHSYAVENNKAENQLIFFWTALETITIKNKNKTIIDNVISFMLPFLKKRYFLENFQYIYDEILFYKEDLVKKIFKDNATELSMINFAKALILDDDKIRESLVDELEGFPSLRHRIYTINKEFDTPEKISKKTTSHEVTIIEQIKRIYRYRNLVIHDARDIKISTTLLSNLHNYFDYILEEIIEHSYSRKITNIEELKLYLEMKIEQNKLNVKKAEKITDENFCELFLL